MASDFRYSITLVDEKALKTTLNFVGTFSGIDANDEYALALAAAASLQTDLLAISDALLYSDTLTRLIGGGSSLPASADITDEAAVVTFLSAAGEIPEYHTLRVPAPIDALFESDGVTVDKTNAGLIAYVANFDGADTEFMVSDGEYIDTTNQNGISHGFWRSRAKSSKKS